MCESRGEWTGLEQCNSLDIAEVEEEARHGTITQSHFSFGFTNLLREVRITVVHSYNRSSIRRCHSLQCPCHFFARKMVIGSKVHETATSS